MSINLIGNDKYAKYIIFVNDRHKSTGIKHTRTTKEGERDTPPKRQRPDHMIDLSYFTLCSLNADSSTIRARVLITNIKKTLKSTQQQGNDEQMVTDSREIPAQSDKPSKKSSKTKGLRGSSGIKLWKS
ncbi:hypothetical protein ScPMuIL_007655 [Solemya velum]